MVDHDERAATIDAAKFNYIAGEFGRVRCEAVLVMCGLNATDLAEFFEEHKEAAFAAFQERNRGASRVR